MSPKRLPGMPLKRLSDTIDYVFTELQIKLLPVPVAIKAYDEEEN
jgi:hypothetical protein